MLLGTPFDLLEYKTLTHIHPSHAPMHICLFLSNPFSLSLYRCLAEAEAEVAEVKSTHQSEMDNVTRLAESQRATFDVEKEMIEANLRDVSAQLEVACSEVHAEKEGQRVAIEAYAALKRELTSVR